MNDPELEQALDTFQLGIPNLPLSGQAGSLLGRGAGSSVEFQEYRQYLPGDDVRHLDWSAFARTDQLMIRLFREEVSPITEILVDFSQSMKTGDGSKERVTRQLGRLLGGLTIQMGSSAYVVPINDHTPLQRLTGDDLIRLGSLPFDGVRALSEHLRERTIPHRSRSLRIVISDFLFPHDPDSLVRDLSQNCSLLWLLQVLSPFEFNPTPLGGRRLVDVETGQELNLMITPTSIAHYLSRLKQLQEQLQVSARRYRGGFVTLDSGIGLDGICRSQLLPAGLLRLA